MRDLIRVVAIATLFAVSSLAGGSVFQFPVAQNPAPVPPALWTE